MDRARLRARGLRLEWTTLGWNVVGVAVLAVAATAARSIALGGFGVDSLIEIGASGVVIWELREEQPERQRRALRLIALAFIALALYLLVQCTWILAVGYRARHSPLGIAWTGATAVVMFLLASAKRRTGVELGNAALVKESRVTFVDGVLASAVLFGLLLNALTGWWWADTAAGYVMVIYAIGEARELFR